MKKVLSFVMMCVFAVIFSGVLTGCEDEVKVHRESETTTEKQTMEVAP
ncbi:MAG: hypothetical protein JW849_00540 [Phycisphaerae bacterium]|nr:hypothetical protein [Phycisphaerae bacterium]